MKYYAVAKGWKTGIFRSFADVRNQTDGYWGKVYKAFKSESEALDFLVKNGCHDPFIKSPVPIYAYAIGRMAEGRTGAGGYGITVMEEDNGLREFSGGFNDTYDWRIDLMAVVMTLKMLKKDRRGIVLHTGSWYIVDAIKRGWLNKWKGRRYWMSGGRRTQNTDLWNKLLHFMDQAVVRFVYVDRRNLDPLKLRAEELAKQAALAPRAAV